ncbi:hypothetical protein M2422_001983 [Enterobacter sp. SLBN-59]|nr:hypothetical protein [Enterobacter sp. SLBN-59]
MQVHDWPHSAAVLALAGDSVSVPAAMPYPSTRNISMRIPPIFRR